MYHDKRLGKRLFLFSIVLALLAFGSYVNGMGRRTVAEAASPSDWTLWIGGQGEDSVEELPRHPVILLKGDLVIELAEGGTYVEPGWTSLDDLDGDLSYLVRVEGHLDTEQAGEYTLTYTVGNQAGLSKSVTRTIRVVPSTPISILDEEPVPLAGGAGLLQEGSPISVLNAFVLVAGLATFLFVILPVIRRKNK